MKADWGRKASRKADGWRNEIEGKKTKRAEVEETAPAHLTVITGVRV